MNPQTLLEQLAPLRQPEPIGWWPLAPGWWLAASLILLALALAAYAWLKRRSARQYRRMALNELRRLEAEDCSLSDLNRIIKITAIQAYGDLAAPLHGDAWLDFLLEHCHRISRGDLAPLADIYREAPPPVESSCLIACRDWIKHHEATNA